MTKTKLSALCACLGFTVIFCSHYLVAKTFVTELDVTAFGACRGIVGGALLAVVFPRSFVATLQSGLWLQLGAVGLFGFCLNQFLLLEGIKHSTATNAALISNTIPLMSYVIGVVTRLEKPSAARSGYLIGGFVAVTVYLILCNHLNYAVIWYGDILMMFNIVSLCISLSIAKRLVTRVPATGVTTCMLLVGGLLMACASYQEIPRVISVSFATPENTILMIFEVAMSTAVAYILNIYALKHLPMSTTTAFAFAQVPVTALLTFWFFDQTPSIFIVPTTLILTFCGWQLVHPKNNKRDNSEMNVV